MFSNHKNHYVTIELNTAMSEKAKSDFQEKAYQIQVDKYGEAISYQLSITDHDGYELVPNHKPLSGCQDHALPAAKKPGNGKFTYVIIPDKNGKPVLRIGSGGHYFLANKAPFVFAAGDITFKDNQISEINNQSGAYHLKDFDQLSIHKQQCYYQSLENVMNEVKLPFVHFKKFEMQSITSEKSIEKVVIDHPKVEKTCNDHLFFKHKALIPATVTVLTTACFVLATAYTMGNQ
jgi:hypothetical protein